MQAAAPASNARVASSPSTPLTSASRGSKSRTAGSSAAYVPARVPRPQASPNRSTSCGVGVSSRESHTSPGFFPATTAHSEVASRRALGSPAAARRSLARSSASAIDACGATRSGTEAFLFSGQPEGVDQVIEVAVEHLGQVVNGVMNAVIGNAVLGEVVGADLLRPVTRADLGATLPGARSFLLRQHPVEQPRAQHLQRLDLVLQLALLILALHHQAARQVRDAHRTVGRVDTLTTRPARAEHVDPQVLVLDLDVHLLRLWEHCDRG